MAISLLTGIALISCDTSDSSFFSDNNTTPGDQPPGYQPPFSVSGRYINVNDSYQSFRFSDGTWTMMGIRETSNQFAERPPGFQTVAIGTYTVSGNLVYLYYQGQLFERMTIVNSNTLRDNRGDLWVK